ncbi:hypothetical protein CWB72_01935 [Pseudoalteromonas phenolica]|uniref:hypothetical protein n=1 Tax=Pseudoalteromonas phenolica TaxID=161398 RepID=UPI00110B0D4C|nr:hypothetical protein [Pseudoalteromonas phenolica]TMN93717.1 hypothetical protein CWB72_01935 [Pseudoalteromonas phenolica]
MEELTVDIDLDFEDRLTKLEKIIKNSQLEVERTTAIARHASQKAELAVKQAKEAESAAEKASKKLKHATKQLKDAKVMKIAQKKASKKFAIKRAKKMAKNKKADTSAA